MHTSWSFQQIVLGWFLSNKFICVSSYTSHLEIYMRSEKIILKSVIVTFILHKTVLYVFWLLLRWHFGLRRICNICIMLLIFCFVWQMCICSVTLTSSIWLLCFIGVDIEMSFVCLVKYICI